MKKGTKIRNVLTDEMMTLIRNKKLTNAQVGEIIRSIVFPGEFETQDQMAEVYCESFRQGYLELTLSCAESKIKELERLNKHYSNPKTKTPTWFGDYYAKNSAYLNNVIAVINNVLISFNNVISGGDNVSVSLADITKAIDNVPLTLNNTNTNTNPNTKLNDTDREEAPKSPAGIEGEPVSMIEQMDIDRLAERIETTYPHHSNPAKLRKCLRSILKKNAAAEILGGYDRHLEAWAEEGYQYAPHSVIDWLYSRRFLDEVFPSRKKAAAAELQTSKFEIC